MRLGLAGIVLVVLEAQGLAAPSAEELFSAAQSAYDNADYTTAIAKWTQSYELSGAPGLVFNIAQAQRLEGACVDALATYKRFIEIDPKSEKRTLADDFVRELEPKCGAKAHAATADLSSTTPGRPLKIAGLVTGGGGMALVATGLLFGRSASTLSDEVSRACSQICDWSAQQDKDARGRRDATTGYVLDAVGVAAIAAGAFMYHLGGRKDAIAVVPQPHEGGVVVTWSGRW